LTGDGKFPETPFFGRNLERLTPASVKINDWAFFRQADIDTGNNSLEDPSRLAYG
jgi:hypothetical protein